MQHISVSTIRGKKEESFIYKDRFFETKKDFFKFLHEEQKLSEASAIHCILLASKTRQISPEAFQEKMKDIGASFSKKSSGSKKNGKKK